MDLELRHLRVLCAIADAGSVARAANVLGYSQQALSTQLRRVERYFGYPLFDRNTAGVMPTGNGVEILARARDIVSRANTIDRPVEPATADMPVLRLAATNSPLLAATAGRVNGQLSSVALTVSSVYSSSEMVALLENDELDAAIAADYPGLELSHSSKIAHRGIVTEPTFVALPAGHRLHNRVDVELADLAGETWFLTPDDGAGWPGVFYAACEAANFAPVKVHEYLGDHTQLQRMIAEGLGISPVQATFCPHGDDVVVKALAGTPLWCRYVLAWRRAGVPASTAEALLAAASATYRDLIARSTHFQAWALRTYKACKS